MLLHRAALLVSAVLLTSGGTSCLRGPRNAVSQNPDAPRLDAPLDLEGRDALQGRDGATVQAADANRDSGPHIALLAGPVVDHGKGTHEYEKSVTLLKHLFDTSTNTSVRVSAHYHGWPEEPAQLDGVASLFIVSDGADQAETRHPFYVDGRLETLRALKAKGMGMAQLHWTLFHPSALHLQTIDWIGGYFDYQTGSNGSPWYSAIQAWDAQITLGGDHSVLNGVKPFTMNDELYYGMRFAPRDRERVDLVSAVPPGSPEAHTLGWVVDRPGGRGFAFTGGHAFANWWNADYRKFIMNGILWTAGVDVPPGGVDTDLPAPKRVLIITGHDHPAHVWPRTTAALVAVLETDPRLQTHVVESPQILSSDEMLGFDAVVLHYNNWDRAGLTDAEKQGLLAHAKRNGGFVVLHFANGAFNASLPGNAASDWPVYRDAIVARTWTHGQASHEPYGSFVVTIRSDDNDITRGLRSFTTVDELYHDQTGTVPIQVLADGLSTATGRVEPVAWIYGVQGAPAFQTVLGHSPEAILSAGALIRRGTAWAAGLTPLSFDPPRRLAEKFLFKPGSQWVPPP